MSAAKEESLSPDEMRKKLYQTFKSRGVLDTLKTQLRNQLIQELQQPVRRGEADPRPVSAHADSVLVSASDSVIIDHLRSSGYDYTLSVFYPESGMNKDKVLSTRDLLQLMKISPHMPLYKSLVSNTRKGQKGFLMSLLMELTDHHVYKDHCDSGTQTATVPDHKESLVEKMQLIDEEYEILRHKGDRWASIEAKLAEYRKEMEEQAQTELKAKVQHFMDVEIAKVKREEKEKSHKEILELRRDMERTYEMKSEALMSREKNAIERLQKQKEIEEKEIYTQRQVLLKDIESVRNRETELKQRMEAFEKTCKLHEEKMKTMEDLLRRRELSVKTMEDTFDQKLKSELMKYQLELKENYIKRTEKLTESEKHNQVESVRLQKESAIIDAKAEEHARRLSELKHLQMELESGRNQTSLLAQQNELLKERLENMSDYPALKRQTLELQAQIRQLKHHLEENHEENQHLRQELNAPSKEQLALQAELRTVETAHKLDKEEFEAQKKVLHTQLQYEVQQCALLKGQLLECEERTKWMTAHAEEVKLQLRQTQQALENEILRNPKPSLVDRSVLSLNPDKVVPPDIYIDSALLRKGRGSSDGDLSEAGVALKGRRHPWPNSEAPERDSELVTGALARIRELEKEAERLEEAYRSHQQRAVQAAVAQVAPMEDLAYPRPTATYIRPTAAAAAQPRVTFAAVGSPLASVFGDREPSRTVEELTRPSSPKERTPSRLLSPPPRRLSSTPVSISKSQPRMDANQEPHFFSQERPRMTSDTSRPVVMFPDLTTERQISPIPAGNMISSRDFTHISPPSSPRMKSTARDNCSPPKLQEVISSSSQESSPQPEKITLHDLTNPISLVSTEQECILENLQDSHTLTPPENTELCQQEEDVRPSFTDITDKKDMHEEEIRWEEERKRKEERRQREREEAQERERRELERLEQELEAQYKEQEKEESRKESTAEDVKKTSEVLLGGEEDEKKDSGGTNVTDPLQKYMMMVMQGKESQKEQSPNKEVSENQSPEMNLLSESKDDSIGALSHDEADEDFW